MKEETLETIKKVFWFYFIGVFPATLLFFSAGIAYMASGAALSLGFEKEALVALFFGIGLTLILMLYQLLFNEVFELRKKSGGW